MTHTYELTGMHCQNCVDKVTGALRRVDGVASAAVSLHPPQARVEMEAHVPTDALDRAVSSVGEYHLREAISTPDAHSIPADSAKPEAKESLYPLFLIVAYIVGVVAIAAVVADSWSPHFLMRAFMGGFFVVFSFFKLLDLRGFADAYQSYDVLARRWPAWGMIYPFVELALGAAYLLNLNPVAVNLATLVVMLLGALGVLRALLDKRSIRCACLGTVLNLPMTTVTLVEDLGMAAMAAIMLAIV